MPVIGSFGITGYHDVARYDGPGVAIGRSGASIGTATYVHGGYWPLNTCLFVRDFKGNDPRWVYRLLHGIDFASFNSGSAQPSLNRNFLQSIPIAQPPVEEQRAIAEVLGALDEKIAANTDLISTAGSLGVSIAETFDDRTPLAEVVTHHKRMVSPESLTDCLVEHYSLPVFDASNTPEEVAPSMIKSGKFSVDQPCVLVSKLNPRFPRIWDVPAVGPTTALASTEFLVLASLYSTSTVLWAVLSQPGFSASLESQVAGTSGSHQRVKPADLLATMVIDPRLMSDSAKDAISSLGQNIASHKQESLKLGALRDALLPELMSGRLQVRDTERRVEAEVR